MASLFSTTSQIAAINTRARSGVITLPLTTASLYRQIMIKDLYGAFPLSTLTLSTQLGDAFEDGTTSRILSNAYEFQALYAGSTSRWHTVGGTQFTAAYISSLRVDSLQLGSGDGWADFGPLRATAISSLLVQTGLVQANAMSTFAISTGTLTAGNISTATLSTNYGFFSTISSGSVFSRFVGDGSLLTGIPNTGAVLAVSNLVTTNATNITTLSNLLNSVSTNVTTVSTNLNSVSNTGATNATNITTVSNTAGTNATNITTLSNLLNSVSTNVTTVSTNLNTVSNTGATNATNITTVSNTAGTNATNITTISNLLNSVSTNVTTISTNLNSVSNTGATNATNITTVSNTAGTNATNITTISNRVNYLLTVSNYSAITMSTSFGFFSTISSGSIYGKFIGNGSLLTGLPAAGAGVTSTLSTLVFLTSSISSSYITSQQGYISSLTVDFLAIGSNFGYVNMGDIIATSLSSIAIETQILTTSNLKVGTVSSLSYIAFPGLQQGYAQSVVAEQSTGTGLQELLVFRGSSASDRIRMQTTGSIIFEPGVSARVYPAVPSNVTPAMIINTSSNVGIGIAAPTTTLDVAGTGRFQILSTQQLFVSTISSGSVFGRFVGDGSQLTGLPAGGLTIIPPVLSTTTLSTNLLTASNISTNSISTNNLTVSNLYGTGITVLPGLSVNTISTSQVNSANISTVMFGASTAYITNLFVGTEDFGSILTANSNIRQTAGTTTLAGLSVNTISTNTILANNISTASLAAYEGFFSTLSSELSYLQEAYFSTINTENLIVQHAFMSSLIVNSIQIGETTGFITMGDVLTNSISTNTLNTSNISNAGNFSNSGSATFFSNGTTAASPSTTNAYPYASFKINSASTNTLTPVTPLLLMTGNYGGSIAGGLTQGVGPVLTLGTIPDGGATQEGYRLTGSNSAFYGNVDMQGNNISNVNSLSTNIISSGTVYGIFIGDGSGLTGLPASGGAGTGVTNNLSTLAFYTSSISSATIQTSNIRIGTISSQSFLAYPGLQQGYAQTVIAEQSTGTGLQELLIFRGSSASDRIRLQTTGFICFETGVGARTFPSVGSNATPSWMIDVNGCVGVGLIPSGTASRLDVAGQGRFQNLSTTSIQAGSINLSVAFV